jgi:divalent metal cation (Fe/Co/Zn/Cd) transporter
MQRTRDIQRVLAGVLVLNVVVAAAKLGYGLYTNSLSMTADGLNSLLDGASNVVGLIGLAVAARPPDPNHPYGHRRFETLTSLAIALFMLLTLFEIVQGSIDRLRHDVTPEVTAISFVVMFSTLVVAAVIAWSAWKIVREAALSLSDEAVASTEQIEQAARSVAGVRGIHNIRTRGGEGIIWVDLHIQVDPAMHVDQAHDIASDVAARIEAELGETADVTVHIEPADPTHLRPERGYNPEER